MSSRNGLTVWVAGAALLGGCRSTPVDAIRATEPAPEAPDAATGLTDTPWGGLSSFEKPDAGVCRPLAQLPSYGIFTLQARSTGGCFVSDDYNTNGFGPPVVSTRVTRSCGVASSEHWQIYLDEGGFGGLQSRGLWTADAGTELDAGSMPMPGTPPGGPSPSDDPTSNGDGTVESPDAAVAGSMANSAGGASGMDVEPPVGGAPSEPSNTSPHESSLAGRASTPTGAAGASGAAAGATSGASEPSLPVGHASSDDTTPALGDSKTDLASNDPSGSGDAEFQTAIVYNDGIEYTLAIEDDRREAGADVVLVPIRGRIPEQLAFIPIPGSDAFMISPTRARSLCITEASGDAELWPCEAGKGAQEWLVRPLECPPE